MSRRTRSGVASGNPTRTVWLDAKAQDTDGCESCRTTGHSNDSTLHVSGQILIFLTEYKQLQAGLAASSVWWTTINA
jgi:hypothetical protein